MLKAFALFALTALAEIFGCYAAYLWLRLHKPAWWLLPGAVSLAAFAWLLTLHPTTGRDAPTLPMAGFTSSPPCCGYGSRKAFGLTVGTWPER